MQNEWRDDCTLKILMINDASGQLSEDKCQRKGYPPGKVMNPYADQKIPDCGLKGKGCHKIRLI